MSTPMTTEERLDWLCNNADEWQARAEKAERELEALLSFSEGRKHDCDDDCSWAHSEYAKLLMNGQLKAERELATELLANAGLLHQLAEAERERDNLLARIHRDGGQHTAEVGSTQSIADAHEVWAGLVCERDEARAERRRAERLGERYHATLARIEALPSTAGYVSADELAGALAPVHEEA